ncbi:OmpL47-type beta-barrel domain-containing protein [Paenibacillus sp. strain BS8-2]
MDRVKWNARYVRRRWFRVWLASTLALTMLFSSAPTYAAQAEGTTVDLVNETFNNTAVGTIPSGWSEWATGSSDVSVQEATYGEHYLRIYDASRQKTEGTSISFPAQTGKVTIQADIQLPAGGTAGKENILFYIHDSANKPAISLIIKPSGIDTIRTTSSGTTTTSVVSNLPLQEWRSLTIAADYASKTYDFYLNGELKQSGIPFRYEDTLGISKLQITGANYNDDANFIRTAHLDNVLIYEGDARVEEPVTDLVNESFDAMEVDTTPANWGIASTGGSYAKVMTEQGSEDHYLQVYDASKQSTQGILKTFTSQTDKLNIEVDIQLPQGATAGKENMLFYVLDSANKAAVALLIRPNQIDSFQTTNGVTTTTTVASGLTANDWRGLTIAIDYPSKMFDVYIDGTLVKSEVPFRYMDALNLSKLQVTGAYYSDNANYIRIANLDDVRIYPGLPDITPPEDDEEVVPPAPGIERNSFDSYSSVFLSSRWYREDGQDGQLGTLDMIKRFMVTDDKWTYLTNQTQISNIVRQGVSFQGSLNTNLGTDQGRAKYFDGTSIVAPWMTWGATWGSVHDPVYYQLALETGKQIIDAGASGIQFDDWAGGVAAGNFGGDFCDACMVQFSEYLNANYSAQQLLDWDITDIETFNYKTYLQTRFNISTNAEYAGIKAQSPLNGAFTQFHYDATVDFHQRLYSDLLDYAGRPFEYSNNAPFIQNSSTSTHFLHDLFSYGMGESAEAALTIDNIVTNGSLATGLGKPHIISPLPESVDGIRHSIAAAYSNGQYVLIPWDVWLHGSTRYFGSVEEYGDIYHFIRQYPFLFDGHEVPAKAGILTRWDEVNVATLRDLSMKLFNSGVPFKDIVVNYDSPAYELKASDLVGLEALIAYTPLSQFSASDQQLIANSGVPVITVQDVNAGNWLSDKQSVSISGADKLYATVRSMDEPNDTKVIHLLNRNDAAVQNSLVTINDADFFGGAGIEAVLYRPGYNPLTLAIAGAGAGKHTLMIPELEEWGIIRIHQSSAPPNDPFQLSTPWSGISIGNPVKEGSAVMDGADILMTSEGQGFNLQLSGDTGTSDQLAYVYQQLEATPLQDFSISTKLGSLTSAESGAMTGLMVRETPASNAKFVAVTYEEGSGLKLRWRDTDNGIVGAQALGQVTLPGYVRLERHDGVYSVSYSSDGLTWGGTLATHAIELDTPLGGLIAAGTGEEAVTFEHTAIDYGELALPDGELTSLTLTSDTSLKVGGTSQLTVIASVYNAGALTDIDVTRENIVYSSSDNDIVTVDSSGKASGLEAGQAVITASFTAGEITVVGSLTLDVTVPSSDHVIENFDGYGVDEVPENWTFSSTIGGYIQIAELPTTTDRSLMMYDNASSGFPSAYIEFEPQDGPIVVEMDFMVNLGAVKQSGGAIVAYLQAGGSANAVSLLVESTGFWYLDGSTSVTVAPVIEDEWNHIRIIADPTTEKMDLWINDVQVVTQGNFRTSTDVISKLLVGGSTGGVDTTAYWNNIRISSVTEPAEEEPAGEEDLLAPESTITIEPGSSEHGWRKSPVTIELEAIDADNGSGVKEIMYSLAGAQSLPEVAVTGPQTSIVIEAEGVSTISYYARDQAGNTEIAKLEEVRIDRTAPSLSLTGGGAYNVDQLVSVSCAAEDALSGLAANPCDTPLLQEEAYLLELGEHTVSVMAEDRAGNQSFGSATIQVTVTYESLANLTSRFIQDTAQGPMSQLAIFQLIKELEKAKKYEDKGRDQLKKWELLNYKWKVLLQIGRTLTQAQADILIRLVQEL